MLQILNPLITIHWRKVRVGFQMPVSSCLTKMSRCRLGGIPTCRKCIKAMRLPRWNGVLWGFSAGLLRCNTRPWHCFLGWHPKSECIISNFCPSMATTDGAPSLSRLRCLRTFSTIFSQKKNKERTCYSVRATPQPTQHTHWREVRVGFQMPVSSCLTKMSRFRLGGIQTCKKCVKAMRLPRWNGVLWGFSAGLLRCNTRPRHCFLGWHPESECIISNFCLTFSTTVSSVFSQRKNQERTCMYEQPSTQHYKHTLAGSEGWVSDACFILFD